MPPSDDTYPEGKDRPRAGAGRGPSKGDAFRSPEVTQPGVVTVTFFGRQYHIRSDKPDLIFQLAFLVQSALNDVKGERSDSELASLDTMVQAAFRLAMQLHNAQGEEKALREHIEPLEGKLQGLLDQIDRTVGGP
jgi:cell division protein ZapA (FtsZ GTPase activity inhibitor)